MPATSYGLNELTCAMAKVGVAYNDTVVLHSSLMCLGRLEGVAISDYPSEIVREIRSSLGSKGTLAVPAPNWDYGLKQLPFDTCHTPVTKSLGVISSYLIQLDGCRRSPNPIFSVAAIGAAADYICKGGVATAFGIDSAWDRLFRLNADMLFLGCGISFMTFVRYIEHQFGVPYLYNKLFHVPILEDEKILDMPVVTLLRYTHCPVKYNLSKFEAILRDSGVLREANLGGGALIAIRMDKCFSIAVEALKEDIHFFLDEIPNYVPGQVPVI
jgi:aminoglycoside 3-N-acetyltransferase